MTSFAPLFSPRPMPPRDATAQSGAGDETPDSIYVFTDEITLALNVALATGRPLLVRGPSGSGKTSLARSAAAQMGCGYQEAVVTARTQARDLMWTTDLLKRLQDAQTDRLLEDWSAYVCPAPLWWALDPTGAQKQHERARPGQHARNAPYPGQQSVLLIDEIDKADPDVPNSLLRPIGDLAFEVEETGERVSAQATPPLIIITTNEERDLPPAFLRRCVELNIPPFDAARLMSIGHAHFPDAAEELVREAAELLISSSRMRERREPNPAEYLDVIRACVRLQITPASVTFRRLVGIALGTGSPN